MNKLIQVIILAVPLSGILNAQTNITAGPFDYLEVKEKVYALFPEKAVLNRPEIVLNMIWDDREPTLGIFTMEEAVNPGNFVAVFTGKKVMSRRKLWTWKPGDLTAKETISIGPGQGRDQFVSIPGTNWIILRTGSPQSNLYTVNRLTKVTNVLTLDEDMSTKFYAGKAGGAPVMIAGKGNEGLEEFQILTMSLSTGEWQQVPLNVEGKTVDSHFFDEGRDRLLIQITEPASNNRAVLVFDTKFSRFVQTVKGGEIPEMIPSSNGSDEFVSFIVASDSLFVPDSEKQIQWISIQHGPSPANEDAPEPPAFKLDGPIDAAVSPLNRFLAVRTSNMVGVREFGTIPPEQFREVQIGAEKQELIHLAKVIGTGILICAMDFDDVLPPAESWKELLVPIVKFRTGLDRFEFLLPGKAIQEIEEPSSTPMGKIKGKHGYVLVYADSHVRWFANP